MTTLPDSLLRAGLEVLLLSSAKGTLLLAAAGIVVWMLRRSGAATRHWVWCAALCCLLLLPLCSLVVPSWSVGILPSVGFLSPAEAPPAPPAAAGRLEPAPLPDAAPEAAPALPVPPAFPDARPTPARGFDLWRWVAALWLSGAAGVGLYLLMGTLGVWRLSRRGRPVTEAAWLSLGADVGWMLCLSRSVRLVWSDGIHMPMTWGVFRPVVLLPREAGEWSPDRRRVVLLHEFAHIHRWDCLTQAFAQAACALNWFNPLVWWAARQLRVERECACDDLVLTAGTRPSSYAGHLLDIARATRRASGLPLGALAMARRSQLEGRVLAILEPGLQHRVLNRVAAGVTSAAFVFAVLPLAAMRPAPEAALPEAAPALRAPARAEEPPLLPDLPPEAWADAPAAELEADLFLEPEPPAASEDVVRRSFPVRGGGRLVLDTDRGDVFLRSGAGELVEVEVYREGADVEGFRLDFEPRGGDLYLYGRDRRADGGADLDVEYRISVPRRFDVELTTAGGDVTAERLTGSVGVRTSGGDLRFENVSGALRGQTSGGDVLLSGAEGDVHVETSGGDVRLLRARGRLQAHTSGGDVFAEEIDGSLDAATSGGSVEARLTRPLRADSRLTTSSGDVTVYLAETVGAQIEARTSRGTIRAEGSLRVTGGSKPTALDAEINGGGPALRLSTSNGDVRVRRLSASARREAPASAAPEQAHVLTGERAWRRQQQELAGFRAELEQLAHDRPELGALDEVVEELAGERARETVAAVLSTLGDPVGRERMSLLDAAGVTVQIASAFETLAYTGARIEVEMEDGEVEPVSVLEVLADLPERAGRTALVRVSERHPDPSVRAEAARLLRQ